VSRLQLALNVSNLEEAVDFYTRFFSTPPTKLRPGYANFAIEEPPLKLVLFENAEAGGTINHLGVEVFSPDDVVAATKHLGDEGFVTDIENATSCCYAVQNKVWVDGPDGSRWEVYTVLADDAGAELASGDEACCIPASDATPESAACC